MAVKVSVKTRGGYSFGYRMPVLFGYGLRRISDDECVGRVSKRNIPRLKDYCANNHLVFSTDNEYGKRSTNYRQTYFSANPPALFNKYFCAYCGKLLPRYKITVDHLYPVAKVREDLKLQKKLKRHGIKELNSAKNLVAACARCNKKKSSKMGYWILRGKIGRHNGYWVAVHTFRIIVICLLAYMILAKDTRFVEYLKTTITDYILPFLGRIL